MEILVVDHQPLIRRGMIEVLSLYKGQHIIKEAGNITEAMRIFHLQQMDIAFVGLHLGDEDGLELIDRAKKIADSCCKFILLASSISIFELKRSKELDVDGYVMKDSFIEDILYAFNVVKRGEKFFPPKLIETSFYGKEQNELRLLTERELDVFYELRKGLTNHQISSNLFITEGTTKKHVSSILNKLKLANRTEAVIYANRLYGSRNV